ncbi:RING finger protein [Pyronema omphalodes]|nr:RING finger protein [Pyronema omphalodes]
MRLAYYGAASTVIATGVVLSAFNQRANFYSACVYLAQSNACLMVLTNILIFFSIVFGHALQLIFYGPLRAMEVEQIYEKAWYAVTETCLAATIFRDDFDIRFIVMFGVLLFIKCFSWIGGGRVEFMEQQPPERPVLFHIRLASSLVLLTATCLGMVWHSITAVLERGKPNMMVMFAFEFAILLITSLGILSRYTISLVEKYILYREAKKRRAARAAERAERLRAMEATGSEEQEEEEEEDEELDVGGWEEKGTWVFYSELCTDFLKLLTYLSFFSIVLTWYGLPLHIIRDVYLTLRSFITRIRDFIRYRRATAHMNSRYPDATADEVGQEGVCIICREEMRPWTEGPNGGAAGAAPRAAGTQDQRHRPKKLPCGHVLHFACLRSWLERQQRCPTCRRPVLDDNSNVINIGRAGGAPAMPQGLQFGNLQFGGAMGDFMDQMNEMNQRRAAAQAPAPPAVQPPAQGAANTPPPQQQQPQTPQPQQPSATEALTRDLQDTQLAVQTQEELLLRRMRERQFGAGAGAGPSGANGANAVPTPTQPATTTAATYQQQAGLPQGLVLPPGWSVIPLTVLVMPPIPETPAAGPSGPSGPSGTSGTEPTASVSATPTTPVPDTAVTSGSTTAPSATSAPETSETVSMHQQGPGATASSESVIPTPTSSLTSEPTASKCQSVNNSHRNPNARLMEEAALRRFASTSTSATASTSVQEAPETSAHSVPATDVQEPHTAGPIIQTAPRNAEPIPTLTNPSLLAQQAAASLQATAANSPFSVPTPDSFAPTGERLNLFGERSLFNLSAQEGVMRSLEGEVRQREDEWRAKRGAVEGLLGGGSSSVTDVTGATGAGRSETQAEAQTQEQQEEKEKKEDTEETKQYSKEEKGKGKEIDRGE